MGIFYKSWSGYNDELCWGSAWLYKATGGQQYLDKARNYANQVGGASEFSWDNKAAGCWAMLCEFTQEGQYCDKLKNFCNDCRNRERSPMGESFFAQWGSLRYASNAAMMCLRAADLGIDTEANTEYAVSQINYCLGDTGRSFQVGFGNNPPQRPHHKASSCLNDGPCSWDQYNSGEPNPYELTGALVGGPKAANDQYHDDRKDYIMNEVTLDYNAGFQTALAGLKARKC